ncbi:unnamed protein product [Enterobius vermicularis]|uniref:DUF1722 domain-containing protein n=1 Tax=Enterobius vermicularis TaxID=51028 RepID=A0A0N4VNQ3_ENTVE|nr:unnamed protein product [Enterobius vermicularis]
MISSLYECRRMSRCQESQTQGLNSIPPKRNARLLEQLLGHEAYYGHGSKTLFKQYLNIYFFERYRVPHKSLMHFRKSFVDPEHIPEPAYAYKEALRNWPINVLV